MGQESMICLKSLRRAAGADMGCYINRTAGFKHTPHVQPMPDFLQIGLIRINAVIYGI